MTLWYDRQGTPLPSETYAEMAKIEKLLADPAYKRVAESTLGDGRWVLTIWLGLDHNFSHGGPPLIFETMVFVSRENLEDLRSERYATEAEALAGHERIIKEIREGAA